MLDTFQAIENEKAVARFENTQNRIQRMEGYGSRDDVQVVIARVIGKVEDAIGRLGEATGPVYQSRGVLNGLHPRLIALCGIQHTFHTIAGKHKGELLKVRLAIGRGLMGEAFAAKLTSDDPKLLKRVHKAAVTRYNTIGRRGDFVRDGALREAWTAAEWPEDVTLSAGNWLLGLVLDALPDVFALEEYTTAKKGKARTEQRVVLMPEAAAQVEEAARELVRANPVFLPMAEPPTPWTGLFGGGPKDSRARGVAVMRVHGKEWRDAIRAAIADGTMAPCLKGLNTLQGVPWKINTWLLGHAEWLLSEGVRMDGMPLAKKDRYQFPSNFQELTDDEKTPHRLQAVVIEKHNGKVMSETYAVATAIETAKLMAALPRFWTPMNMDFRGRIYGLSTFNFQREDLIRALHLFADGAPLGPNGYYWLCVHAASCWGGDDGTGRGKKTDKLPFAERVAWVERNMEKVRAAVSDPRGDTWWRGAGDPFLFLAACREVVESSASSDYVCHLPVSFDGSCSGLQHFSCMTRSSFEGPMVNLLPTEAPADVYQTVADWVTPHVKEIAEGRWSDEMAALFPEWSVNKKKERVHNWPIWEEVARMWLAYSKRKHKTDGIARKDTKRNVMTWGYSAVAWGMAGQVQEDTIDVISRDCAKPEEHDFYPYQAGSAEFPSKAAQFLGKLDYHVIQKRLGLPGQAKDFLRDLAGHLAHAGGVAKWTTPVGLPWLNWYYVPETVRLNLWLHGKSSRTYLATGDGSFVDKDGAKGAIAPNFVHACDASHLFLTAIAAKKEGIEMATVHDSFGCLPGHADRLRSLIKETLVQMYTDHDVLAEILATTTQQLQGTTVLSELPALPEKGDLDLNDILASDYAFA